VYFSVDLGNSSHPQGCWGCNGGPIHLATAFEASSVRY
jgi:hypothetical protein